VNDSELKYWVALQRIPGIGPVRFGALERAFDSLADAWTAPKSALMAAGLSSRAATKLVAGRPDVDPDGELGRLYEAGVRVLTVRDEGYPPRLKEVHARPLVLFVKGDVLPEDERSVAVVGTRKASAYGREVAAALSGDLARSGVTVVSGLARGIDGIAHDAALNAGGRTIAVLGSGLDVMYPREHEGLAERVAESGALVSEFPLGTRPSPENFPRRNRIISGMSLGTLVVEASERSGALITSSLALEQNREVFAVPGNMFDPHCRATNNLIKRSGAKLVTHVEDILEELNLTAVDRQLEMPTDISTAAEGEGDVLKHVTFDPIHIDEITRTSGLAVIEVSGALAMLELRGRIKQVGGRNYVRLRESSPPYTAAV
jgi:DNA processing protein